jgi:hypothetical protein
MIPQEQAKATRTPDEVHPLLSLHRDFDARDERPLLSMLRKHPVEPTIIRRSAHQRREENTFFDGLVVLISTKSKELKDSCNVGKFDPYAFLHPFDHPIENIQAPSNDCMILNHKFCAFHKSDLTLKPTAFSGVNKKTPRNTCGLVSRFPGRHSPIALRQRCQD